VSKVKTAKISSPAPPDDLQPAHRADVAAFSTEEKVLVELRKIIRATQINAKQLARETGLTTSQLVVM
jgi:hypothetical protein